MPEIGFKINPTSEWEVLNIIKNLNNSKASGYDEVGTDFIKLGAKYLAKPIAYLTNLSIDKAIFPDLYKIANVSPLYKGKNMLDPSGFRPVSLLCSISKILEKVICIQLTEYLESNKLISSNHHAYRKGHSTITALSQLEDMWSNAHAKKLHALALLIDSSAAFDCVNHEILLEKLNLYKIKDNELEWFKSYLTNRKQRVLIGSAASPLLNLNEGVPQGSILGPILYTIMTNGMTDILIDKNCKDPCHGPNREYLFGSFCTKCGVIVCYADDATITITGHDNATLQKNIDKSMGLVSSYLKLTKLKINEDKTIMLRVTRPYHNPGDIRDPLMYLADNGKVIEPSNSTKLLGLTIDKTLSWSEHLFVGGESLATYITRKIWSLNQICRHLSKPERIKLIGPLINSKIVYAIQNWGSISKTDLRAFQTYQNKAARLALHKFRGSNTKDLLNECKWLSCKQLIWYHSITSLHRFFYTKQPAYFTTQFVINPLRAAGLRQNKDVMRIKPNRPYSINKEKYQWKFRSTTMWNTIPMEIRGIEKYVKFKWTLKKWINDNISVKGDIFDEIVNNV